MTLDSETFEKWEEWGQKIHEDLSNRLMRPRQMFRSFNEMAIANAAHLESHGGGEFFEFVAHGYITQVAMAIRRHSKDDKSISFMRMLMQVKKSAPQFTYAIFLRQHPIRPDYVEWQKPTFAQFSDDGIGVSETKVDADITQLNTLTAKVVHLCDKDIAHLDPKGYSGSVTFGEIETCIDTFDKLVCKYFKLTTQTLTGFSTLEPVDLTDWEEIFVVPMDAKNTTWKNAAQPEED